MLLDEAGRHADEAVAVAQLSHPNIVAVYDAIEEQIGGQLRAGLGASCVGNGSCLPSLRCSTVITTGTLTVVVVSFVSNTVAGLNSTLAVGAEQVGLVQVMTFRSPFVISI